MSEGRFLLFDYAKGIGIILVVYGHVARGILNAGMPIDGAAYRLADSIVYSFHMPLFFFISGYFFLRSLEKRGPIGLIGSKVGSVLYPYMVWMLLQGGLELALARYTNGTTSIDEILSLAWEPRAQYWFLYTLFGIFLVASTLYWRATSWRVALLFILAVVCNLHGYWPTDIYMVNAVSIWFVYFALGVSASRWLPRLENMRMFWIVPAALAFAAAEWLFHVGFGMTVGNHVTLAELILAALGIAMVLVLGRAAASQGWGWLAFVGRHSMEIYLVHVLAAAGMRIVLQHAFGIGDPALHVVLGMAAGIGGSLLFMHVARRVGLDWLFSAPRLAWPAAWRQALRRDSQ